MAEKDAISCLGFSETNDDNLRSEIEREFCRSGASREKWWRSLAHRGLRRSYRIPMRESDLTGLGTAPTEEVLG
jgi:hypothetical protein